MITFNFKSFTQQQNSMPKEKKEAIKKKFQTEDNKKGWYDLERQEAKIKELEETAIEIRQNCDIFLVIGIGGSFLGAKALYEALRDPYQKETPEIIFTGTSLPNDNLTELKHYLKGKRMFINVISKSGNTLETILTFQELLPLLKETAQEDWTKRIIITTNNQQGKLFDFANQYQIKRFTIEDDIGGRFSVLSTVGLLPLAVAQKNIRDLLEGAKKARSEEDLAYAYAFLRDQFYQQGKELEAFVIYDEKLSYFTEWLKQLFAESQGKKNKGLFPVSLLYSRDLHSLGQYLQEGKTLLFETHIRAIQKDKDYNTLEEELQKSVCESHVENQIPSILITMDQKNEWNFGYLIFFFYLSAMVGSYLLDVPYYNQNGVEVYKKKLTKALEKEKITLTSLE